MSIYNRPARIFAPASRTTDPATSKQAEAKHLGKRAERARQVLELVKDYPNHTSGELGRKMYARYGSLFPMGVCAATPHKRLPDLRSLGLVKMSEVTRPCNDSGYEAHVWEITERGRSELEN